MKPYTSCESSIFVDFKKIESPSNSKSKLISMRLPISMLGELKLIASYQRINSYQKLIKRFITDGLEKERL